MHFGPTAPGPRTGGYVTYTPFDDPQIAPSKGRFHAWLTEHPKSDVRWPLRLPIGQSVNAARGWQRGRWEREWGRWTGYGSRAREPAV